MNATWAKRHNTQTTWIDVEQDANKGLTSWAFPPRRLCSHSVRLCAVNAVLQRSTTCATTEAATKADGLAGLGWMDGITNDFQFFANVPRLINQYHEMCWNFDALYRMSRSITTVVARQLRRLITSFLSIDKWTVTNDQEEPYSFKNSDFNSSRAAFKSSLVPTRIKLKPDRWNREWYKRWRDEAEAWPTQKAESSKYGVLWLLAYLGHSQPKAAEV